MSVSIKINPPYSITDNYSYLDYVSSNNQELAKVACFGLALILGLIGITAIAAGHRFFPQLVTTVKKQYIYGGEILLASGISLLVAWAIPKIVREIKEWKVRNLFLKNYVLVGTNLDTNDKNLKKLLRQAKVIALTETHTSDDMINLNKRVIEGLWQFSSFFLSETKVLNQDCLIAALETYNLNVMKIHQGASWDIKRKKFDQRMSNQAILLEWGKKLLLLKDCMEAGNIKSCEKDFLDRFEKDLKETPELEKLRKPLLAIFAENATDVQTYNLFRVWFRLLHKNLSEGMEYLMSKEDKRQNSLASHAIHYSKTHQVFLVAGTSHLAKKDGLNWEPDSIVSDELKKAEVPYVILHSLQNPVSAKSLRFWQSDEILEKLTPISENIDGMKKSDTSAKVKGIAEFQKKRAALLKFNRRDDVKHYGHTLKYIKLFTDVFTYELQRLSEKIESKNS